MLVRLHPDFIVTKHAITDQTLGVRYMVSDDAAILLHALKRTVDTEHLIEDVARRRNVEPTEVRQAFYALLGYMDAYGGIIASDTTWRERLRRISARGLWRRRYTASGKGFMQSMLHAYGLPVSVSTAIFAGAQVVAESALPLMWSSVPLLLFLSCVAHEAGHAFTARRLHVTHVFLAKPGFAAIMYARPARHKERLIAACGPLIATLFCIVCAIGIRSGVIGLLCLAAGSIHACSVLPWLADGKTIWRKYDD